MIRAGKLAEEGKPYVLATVVRVERPASTRPGDRALVTPEGQLEGWVGGACSEPIVIREALRALADGEPRLVRIGPPGRAAEAPGDVVVAESSCASEGVVEVLVEPQVPRPLLVIVGDSAAALTLAELARTIDWRVTTELTGDADAVVVATMGHADEEALRGSSRRPGGVRRARGERPARRSRARRPAGARTRRGAAGARAQPGRARPRPGDAAGDRRRDPGGARRLAPHRAPPAKPSCSRRSIRSAA